jgi:hypothetical protein
MMLRKPRRFVQNLRELEPTELVALRDLSKCRLVEAHMLQRLGRQGLAELSSGVWAVTPQGEICLMFAAAH